MSLFLRRFSCYPFNALVVSEQSKDWLILCRVLWALSSVIGTLCRKCLGIGWVWSLAMVVCLILMGWESWACCWLTDFQKSRAIPDWLAIRVLLKQIFDVGFSDFRQFRAVTCFCLKTLTVSYLFYFCCKHIVPCAICLWVFLMYSGREKEAALKMCFDTGCSIIFLNFWVLYYQWKSLRNSSFSF